ncbi:MAG: hypothetical protein V3W37_02370 [Candidatus Binatia bacterium]
MKELSDDAKRILSLLKEHCQCLPGDPVDCYKQCPSDLAHEIEGEMESESFRKAP